jgi:hypothetical protein
MILKNLHPFRSQLFLGVSAITLILPCVLGILCTYLVVYRNATAIDIKVFTSIWSLASIFAAMGFQIFYVIKRRIFTKLRYLKAFFLSIFLTFIVSQITQFCFNILDIFPTNKLACMPEKFANFAAASSCMIELVFARLDVDINMWLYPIIVLEIFLIITSLLKNRSSRKHQVPTDGA